MKKQLNPKERAELFHSILGMGRGADLMEEIERLFGMHSDTFHPDPYQHAFNAGQRAAVVKIKHIVDTDINRLEGKNASAS